MKPHRVIVTRPPRQAAALCEALTAAGAEVLRLPLFDIQPTQPASIPAVEAMDWLIFTSPNAVLHGLPLLGRVAANNRIAAVGAATAKALQDAGVAEVLLPEQQYSSEGLLAISELQQLDQQRILLIKGEGGRVLLSQQLKARGAVVEELLVYRRMALQPSANEIRTALQAADSAIVTSGEILQRLHQLTPQGCRPQLLNLQLVVPSERMVQMAQTLGFHRVLQLASPLTNAALVEALLAVNADASTGDHS